MGSIGFFGRGVGMRVRVVGMVRPGWVLCSTAKKCPVTAIFSRENPPFPVRPEIPTPSRRAVFFHPARPGCLPPGQNKSPGRTPPGLGLLAFALTNLTLPVLLLVQTAVVTCSGWWLVAQGWCCARRCGQSPPALHPGRARSP